MEVKFTPDVQARLDQLATETGRPKAEFVRDFMASYFEELERTREMLDSRYDNIKSGKVKLVPGDDALPAYARKARPVARSVHDWLRFPSGSGNRPLRHLGIYSRG